MLLRVLTSAFVLVGILIGSAGADQELPAGVINVALPEFGNRVGGGDYGLANVEPVEVRHGVGGPREVRIVRTPQLHLSRRGDARFQVLLGDVGLVNFWIEAPPRPGAWHLTLSLVHPDGNRESIFSESLLREGLNFARVPPGALLEFLVIAKRTPRLSKQFMFTVSPARISLWSEFRPLPLWFEWRMGPP